MCVSLFGSWYGIIIYPLVIEHSYRKSLFFMGKSTRNGHVPLLCMLNELPEGRHPHNCGVQLKHSEPEKPSGAAGAVGASIGRHPLVMTGSSRHGSHGPLSSLIYHDFP